MLGRGLVLRPERSARWIRRGVDSLTVFYRRRTALGEDGQSAYPKRKRERQGFSPFGMSKKTVRAPQLYRQLFCATAVQRPRRVAPGTWLELRPNP